MRVAVVGAGPVGLVALYTLERSGLDNLELVGFERESQPGGEWIFTEQVGNDEYGIPVHGSMYRGMRANLPKDVMIMHPDFPWPKETNEFPFREEVLDHICNFAEKFSLTKYYKFRHYIRCVSKLAPSSSQLVLEVEDLEKRVVSKETFDYVLMCGGKNGKPFLPHDTSAFTGKVLHYHDLKDPRLLTNKRVLLVGSSFGAMDMVVHLLECTSLLVLSYHRRPPFFGPQPNVIYKPQIVSFYGSSVTFEDESSYEFDVILYCTGFVSSEPLSPELQLDWTSYKNVFFPLYKHVVHPGCPTLLYIGKAVVATILIARIQTAYACEIIKGNIKLPCKEEMLAEITDFRMRWMDKLINPTQSYKVFMPKPEMEFELIVDLAKQTACQPLPAILKKLFYTSIQLVTSDLLNYQNYQLVITELEDGTPNIYWKPPDQRRAVIPRNFSTESNSEIRN